jgi:hypothetical protein
VQLDDGPRPQGGLLESDSAHLPVPQGNNADRLVESDFAPKGTSASTTTSPRGATTPRRIGRRPECENRWRLASADGQISFWCP